METTIKDLILSDDAVIEERRKEKKAPRKPAEYEVATVSGPDFAVRKKGSKTASLLVCICSKGQFYIKNENTGDTENLDAQGLTRFLSDIPKYSTLPLTDQDGKRPFWIGDLDKTKDFAENLIAALNDETLRRYFCKDMLSFSDISDYIERRRKMRYCSPADSDLSKRDFRRARFIFDQAAEIYPRDEVKAGFSECINSRGRSESKLGSMFQLLLKTADDQHSYYLWRDLKTLYDWLFGNWGIEGVRRFIKTYLETPVAYLTDTLERSRTIQGTSFAITEFLDYCFCECTKQGYAENPGNFIQSWEDYLDMQIQVYGRIQKKYSEYLASDEMSLSYKYSKLREAEQVQNFRQVSKRLQMFEGKVGKYVIIAPKTPKDMIEEGQMMSNCVASYIERVANGNCMIFFMRTRKEPDRSLVTIEVRDGNLVQVKGRFNKRPTDEQNSAVNTWFRNAFQKPKQISLLD